MRIRILILIFAITIACNTKEEQLLQSGIWRASLETKDNAELPFNFEVTKAGTIKVFNAEEIITVDEITIKEDSIIIRMPVFEGYIAGTITENEINGEFIKPSLDRIVPFTAKHGVSERFLDPMQPSENISGKWESYFSPNSDEDRYEALGIFNQKDNGKVTGTFRTTTGDYRYLEGIMDGDSLKLSAFDGAHAFLFHAKVDDSIMDGVFYSGNHFKESFVAKRNENYELPDPESLTYLKDGYEKLEFSFPDENGNTISLSDDRFKNKVVVVQIMGTWCPNCLDETKFYSDFYKKNKDIEFVALAFEYAKTPEKAFKSIKRLKEKVGIEYPILLAQYGTSSKTKAQEKLPMLNHILSYPSSIFIDKKGKVRKIHTGFNGPATGDKYVTFKKGFENFIEKLRSE
ncbi:TlpA disulfide reductase family protein [Leptobacterium sp. I13]|uniref:peroxiredoxin family protein n=1 Tax=Leptobacterium meishanense TaxID=3128904 RepID=UPI0030ED16F4